MAELNADARIRILRELKETPGWGLLRSFLERQEIMLARLLVAGETIDQQALQYKRGMLSNHMSFLTLPDRLIQAAELEKARGTAKQMSFDGLDPEEAAQLAETDGVPIV